MTGALPAERLRVSSRRLHVGMVPQGRSVLPTRLGALQRHRVSWVLHIVIVGILEADATKERRGICGKWEVVKKRERTFLPLEIGSRYVSHVPVAFPALSSNSSPRERARNTRTSPGSREAAAAIARYGGGSFLGTLPLSMTSWAWGLIGHR